MSWTAWEASRTAATFKAIFPEFSRATDALVLSRITMAEQRTEVEVWGDLHSQGVAWLTAHLLCLLPEAKDLRLDQGDGMTPYGRERDRLARVVSSGYRVAVAGLHS